MLKRKLSFLTRLSVVLLFLVVSVVLAGNFFLRLGWFGENDRSALAFSLVLLFVVNYLIGITAGEWAERRSAGHSHDATPRRQLSFSTRLRIDRFFALVALACFGNWIFDLGWFGISGRLLFAVSAVALTVVHLLLGPTQDEWVQHKSSAPRKTDS
jgi:hypothetical protein